MGSDKQIGGCPQSFQKKLVIAGAPLATLRFIASYFFLM